MFYNNYSVLPINIVVDLIANLNLSNLKILSKYFEVDKKLTLFTVLPYKKDYLNFIIVSTTMDEIQFYGVNYQMNLLNCWILENVTQVEITTRRGIVKLFWGTNSHIIPLHVPKKCISFDEAKSSVLSIFTLPSFTFVLCNKIIFHCTKFQNKIFPSFIGHFENDSCVSDTEWDISKKFLIGKIYKSIVYILNDLFCKMTNQYPDIGSTANANVLFGNGYNYLIDFTPDKTSKITYAYPNSLVAPELAGNSVHSIFFKDFIPINQSIMFFLGVVHPILSGTIKSYAVLGSSSSFANTKATDNTISLEIEYVNQKDDTFQKVDTMFFKLMIDKMLIFQEGFSEFLIKNTSNKTLSNLRLYDSNEFQYDPIKNRLISKILEEKEKLFSLFQNKKIQEYFNHLAYHDYKYLEEKDKKSILLKYFGKPYFIQ